MDSMQILSRIYDLLSQCTDQQLKDAARLAGEDTELAEALMMLYSFKRSAKRRRPIPGKRPRSTATVVRGQSKFTSNGLGKQLSDVVLTKQYFPTNRELVDHLRRSKVPFNVSVKDSRKRILGQIVRWIDKMPPEKQKSTYMNLLRVLPQSDTAGWFDAIRDSKS